MNIHFFYKYTFSVPGVTILIVHLISKQININYFISKYHLVSRCYFINSTVTDVQNMLFSELATEKYSGNLVFLEF